MKRLLIATAVATALGTAHATPVYHPPGPNLTYGDVSNGQTIMSEIGNPAAGAAALAKEGGGLRFGILSSVGAGFEYGDVDNMFDTIDQQAQSFNNATYFDANDIQLQVNGINNVLNTVATDGYVKGFFSGHIPLMPLVVASEWLGGSVVMDINASAVTRAHVLYDSVAFDANTCDINTLPVTCGDITVNADSTFTVNNDSTLLVKGAGVAEIALGYSRKVLDVPQGRLFAGLRGKYFNVGLGRITQRLADTVNNSQSAFDNIDSGDYTTSSGLGLDAGILWVSTHYRAGATLNSINEPNFDYNTVDLSAYIDPTGPVYQTLSDGRTYTMAKQFKLEAAVFSQSQNWVLSAALDANAVADPLGDDYQWLSVSAAYATDSWWIPGLRVGYRANQAGTKLSYATGGLTLFKSVNLDVAYALDSVVIDNSTVPRGAIVNLGLEMSF